MTFPTRGARRTVNQQALEEFKRGFAQRTKYGSDLLAYLQRSECGVWRCEADDQDARRWWINVTLPNNVAEMFDAHLEIQLVYVEYERVEPRLLELVQRRIYKDARVDPGIMIITSLDPGVERLARRRRGEFAAIDLDLAHLGPDAPDIRQRMSSVMTSVDHYDITSPIRDPSGFFGRQAEFEQIISAIERGQSTGVFGLRKTGKTSLLNYVSRRRTEAGRPVVWLDISGLAGADDFRRRVVEGTFNVARARSEIGSSGRLPRLRTLGPDGDQRGGAEALRSNWLRDVELLAAFLGDRLEVFIDEIDQVHPSRSYLGEEEATKLLVAVTQLRGMIQGANPNAGIVLVCAGVDPALFERPLLASGADNLLYKLVRLMFLAPLTRDEMAEMVRDLGRRMGVRVRDHKAIDFLFAEYGGHPLLTRKACSLAVRQRQREEVPWQMSLAAVEEVATLQGDGTPLQQASEILESFIEWFPSEGAILRDLWATDPEDRELARLMIEEDPEQVAHAAPYGLLETGTITARVRAVQRAAGGF